VAGLSSLLDRLSGFFGRPFLVAGLLPALVALTVHAVLAVAVFPHLQPEVRGHLAAGENGEWWIVLFAVVALGVLGFVTWTLHPRMLRLLQGYGLPAVVTDALTRVQQARFEAIEDRLQPVGLELYRLRRGIEDASGSWIVRLRDARGRGKVAPSPNPDAARKAAKEAAALRAQLERQSATPTAAQLDALCELVAATLRSADADTVREADEEHKAFLPLAFTSEERVTGTYARLMQERQRFPARRSDVGPTAMANLEEVARDKVVARYGIDLDGFAAHRQDVMAKDDPFADVLDQARSQLEMAVAITVHGGLVTGLWTPLALLYAPTIVPYVAVTLAGGAVTVAFYGATVDCFARYVTVQLAAIDLLRFKVLRALHLALPEDAQAERRLWEQIYAPIGVPELTYDHAAQ